MPSTPNILIEIATRHQVHLERLKSGAQGEFDSFLREMQRDIVAQIAEVEDMDSLKGRRLNRLLKAVRNTLKTGFGNYEAVWRQQLADLAEYEGGFEARTLQRVFGVDFTLPSPSQMVTAAFAKPLSVQGIDQGQLLQSFFDGWSDKTFRRVEGSIRLSAAQGESLTQAIRRLRGTRARNYRDGLFHATRRDMAMLVRTSMQHVAVQAKEAVWDRNRDIIKGVEWAAVLDGRTSTICRSLDGQVFPVDEGPRPPAHIACRSVTVPQVRDGLSILGKKGQQTARGADGIKQVAANQDYYQWLKTQPAEFQDSVIGSERGKLLRSGGLSPERFRALQLDKNFRPLTLEAMRELEPAAFEAAGI
ncbi:minor capsid protein [uncultured Ruegeria sp.]|uniref:minor capsid protein n=1 Tax=uncultured Ruegeria sp. TaxID=259304 RepID=UPI00263574EE|nr:minor capsid protein [uncultured Ruegeria sp.]